MKAIIVYYLKHLVTITLAPFYFHLNNTAYVEEFNTIAFDAIDIAATYYLFFFFLIAAVFLRNQIFSFLTNHVFVHYNLTTLRLSLCNNFTTFWNFLKTFFSKK